MIIVKRFGCYWSIAFGKNLSDVSNSLYLSENQMRLTFAIGSLEGGGAERNLVLLAESFAKKGHLVTVLTLFGEERDFYTLSPLVKRVSLGLLRSSQVAFFFLKLRKALIATKPDVVISFMCRMNIMTVLSILGSKIAVIVCERIDPRAHRIASIWKWLRWWIYPKADRIVVQSRAALDYFLPRFQSKTDVIPNPVIPLKAIGPPNHSLPKPALIAMGRLHEQKGFDLLLKAFERIKRKHPTWGLSILGDGPLKGSIQSLIKHLELSKQVRLLGLVKNPYDYLRQADLFVLSSRYEGFPNALCEAMACGLPVISTDCPSGPSDIIRDGIDGVLVPQNDVKALALAMDHLMADEDKRKRLASCAPEVVQRFGVEKIVNRWESLLVDVSKTKQA